MTDEYDQEECVWLCEKVREENIFAIVKKNEVRHSS